MATHDQEDTTSIAKPTVASSGSNAAPLPKLRADAAPATKPVIPGSGPLPKPRRSPGSLEAAGHKEVSWVRPSHTTKGGSLVHVGSIFFRTKDHTVDERDRSLVTALAEAYARYSAHYGRRHTTASIWGKVVGYADPRSSHTPDNLKLSSLRATNVAAELTHAFELIQLPFGFHRIDHEGVGVDPAAPTEHDDEGVEGNDLAPFRRAEIYIAGRGDDDLHPPTVQENDSPKTATPKAPDYSGREHGMDSFQTYVAMGDKRSIREIARRVLMNMGWEGVDDNLKGRLIISGIESLSPPWWETRNGEKTTTGRGGPMRVDKTDALIHKTRILIADYKRYSFYVADNATAEGRWFETRDKNSEEARRLGYILFMIDAIGAEANEVLTLATDEAP